MSEREEADMVVINRAKNIGKTQWLEEWSPSSNNICCVGIQVGMAYTFSTPALSQPCLTKHPPPPRRTMLLITHRRMAVSCCFRRFELIGIKSTRREHNNCQKLVHRRTGPWWRNDYDLGSSIRSNRRLRREEIGTSLSTGVEWPGGERSISTSAGDWREPIIWLSCAANAVRIDSATILLC